MKLTEKELKFIDERRSQVESWKAFIKKRPDFEHAANTHDEEFLEIIDKLLRG